MHKPAAVPVANAPPVPLLWKVSDADSSLYLLGSFHMLLPGDYPLSKEVDAAFADSKDVVFEIPPEEMSSPTLAIRMGQAALRGDGKQLDASLPPATTKRLDAWVDANEGALQKAGIPGQMLQLFEPWFVGLTVSIVEMSKQGLDPKLGLDQHFSADAQAAKKPTSGLETGDEQIAFLDGMGEAEQVQFLDETLQEAAEGSKEVARLHSAWRAGDADTLWNGMAVEMRDEYPALYKRINVARNDAWVPKLEQRLRASHDGNTLVVVGSLHLIGSDGVVEKLRAKGYKVERICSACKSVH
ncbi:TraB/GumN family protein [Lysobacter lycopersici]